MKDIVMFIQKNCPYCRRAKLWMDELMQEHPEFAKIRLTVIDENLEPEVASKANYYYVPTYFVGGVKEHEGVASKAKIERIFLMALGDRDAAGPPGAK